MGLPGGRTLGARTHLLGGMDGGPSTDADDLARAFGGALGASLAGSDPGAETVVGDAALRLERVWGPQVLGRGFAGRPAVGGLGPIVSGAQEDRAAPLRRGFKRGSPGRSVAAASDPGIRPAGPGRTAGS